MTGTKYLCDSQFNDEDDFSYLEDQSRWLRRLTYRITPDEIKESVVQIIQNMITEIEQNPARLDVIAEKVFSRGAEHTYLAEVKLGDLDFNQRKEIEACFVATIFRYIILSRTPEDKKDTKEDRERFRAKLKGEYAEFMQQETGNDNELTWMFRFERAIILAKSYINGNRNKGLFLSVGNLLEGSDDFTRYITGGHSSRETKRRVLLIEHLCDIKPRKRTRKLAAEAPIQRKHKTGKEPGTTNLLQLAHIASAMELKEFDHCGCQVERLLFQNFIYRLYVGKLIKTSSDVKIKSYSRHFSQLFHRECAIMKKLNSRDCVVQMIEYSDDSDVVHSSSQAVEDSEVGKLFIVFETFQQRTISDVIGMSVTVILNVLLDFVEAVLFIHGRGIVIKNLRPENIVIVGPYYNTRVKIADFTHAEDLTESSDKSLRLTPEIETEVEDLLMEESLFIAPELCSKEMSLGRDYKADVWSIGMITLYLFSCNVPSQAIVELQDLIDSNPEKCQQIIDNLINSVDCPEPVKTILRYCLDVFPNRRKSLLEIRALLASDRSSVSLNNEGSKYLQSLDIFHSSVRSMAALQKLGKLGDGKRGLKMDSEKEGAQLKATAKSFSMGSETSIATASTVPSLSEANAKKAFRRLVNVVMAANRFQRPSNGNAPLDALLNGKISSIAVFITHTNYSYQLAQNNRVGCKQVVKHWKINNVQADVEYAILRSLTNHMNVCTLQDYVEEGPNRYLMVEWLEGGFLVNVLNQPSPVGSDNQKSTSKFTEKCLVSIAKGLFSAIDYIHSKGIIHRGLNPSNLLMKRINEEEMMVKIWNFHTAIVKDPSFLPSYSNANSTSNPSYYTSTVNKAFPKDDDEAYYCVAPEILSNLSQDKLEPYDERVDYWSLGMTLLILNDGKSCFPLKEPIVILRDILQQSSHSKDTNAVEETKSDDMDDDGDSIAEENAAKKVESDAKPTDCLISNRNNISELAVEIIEGLIRLNPGERVWLSDERVLKWLKVDALASRLGSLQGVPLRLGPGNNPVGWMNSSHISSSTIPPPLESVSMVSTGGLKPIAAGPNISKNMPPPTYSMVSYGPGIGPAISGNYSLNALVPAVYHQNLPIGSNIAAASSPSPLPSGSQGPDPSTAVFTEFLQSEVVQKRQYYIKYFQYQKCLETDRIDEATQLSDEMMKIDSQFEPTYKDQDQYCNKLREEMEKFIPNLNQFKQLAIQKPLLFKRYKELQALKSELEELLTKFCEN